MAQHEVAARYPPSGRFGSSGAAASAPLLNFGNPDPFTVRSFDTDDNVDQIARALKSSFLGLEYLGARPIRPSEAPYFP
jgi:hypothetical protein